MNSTKQKTPWEKPNPKRASKKKKLSPAEIQKARGLAKKAGRPYPNLTDNMRVAKAKK